MVNTALPNLRHLRAVVEVARRGSIRRAAEAVHLTQPAITQALAGIEATLGVPLFERRPDGMASTQAALLIVPRLEAALARIANRRVTAAQVRALIAVADAGSYADAGHATGLSEPSLHRAVGNLALALGRPLVERRGRGIALTDAGRRWVRAFRLARAEYVAGLSEVAALNGRETGRITIGAMPLCRARLLPAAVTAFHAAHPQADIRIVEGSHAELIEPLRDGDIDLLIGALRDPGPSDDVEQRALFEDRPVVIGRAGHSLARAGAIDAAMLARYAWTVPAPGAPLRLLWERMFAVGGVPAPPVKIECGSVIAIRQILMGSDFLTLLSPDQVAVEIEAGWLTRIGDTPGAPARTIGTTTRAGWRPTATQRAFVAALEGAVDPLPTRDGELVVDLA